MSKQVFKNIKIADFSWVVAGPLITKYFADHGAEVIRIESATRPETLRVTPPFKNGKPGLNRSAYYACCNNNKYGLSLNINHPGAKQVLDRLIKWADIVVESFTPGTMAKWGMAYEDLVNVRPDIIMCSTSQQGQTGPRAQVAAYGTQLVSLSGFTHLTGWSERAPTGPYGPYTDSIAPPLGAAAVIAALIHRLRTGKGTHIDLSQLEAGIYFLSPIMLDYAVNKRIAQREGNRCTRAAPHGVYPCHGDDKWCAIAVFTDTEWERFCQIMGKPELTCDPRFSTLLQRKRNEEELDRIVSEWTSCIFAEEALHRLQQAGIAAGIAQTTKDVQNDPQLAHRYFFCELNHREIGNHSYEGPPFRLSKTPADLNKPSPCLGEDAEYVCTKILGMSDELFIELLSEGVLE